MAYFYCFLLVLKLGDLTSLRELVMRSKEAAKAWSPATVSSQHGNPKDITLC